MPEWQPRGTPGSRRDDDAVARDLLDLPGGGAQCDHIADARFVDHFLVELADPLGARARVGLRKHHRVQPAIGDRAAAGHGQTLRAGPCGDDVAVVVPDQRRPERRELLALVATGHHGHDRVEHASVEIGEWGRPAYRGIPFVRFEIVHRRGRHGLLREDVQRIAGHRQWLEFPGRHALDGRRHPDELLPGQRIEQGVGHAADPVVGAADALQAGGHGQRRRDLDNQIDRPHIDAQFQAARGDHAAQLAAFELLLDMLAAILGHRPVMRHRDDVRRIMRTDQRGGRTDDGIVMEGAGVPFAIRFRLCPAAPVPHLRVQVVEPGREFFRQAARIDEHQRGAVRQNLAEHAALHHRPDRTGGPVASGPDDGRGIGRQPFRPACAGRGRRPGAFRGAGHSPALRKALHGRGDAGDARSRRLAGIHAAGPVLHIGGLQVAHIRQRFDHAQIHGRPRPGVHDAHRTHAAEKARDLPGRVHRGRQPDALRRARGQSVEPFQTQRQMRAAFGARDRMHLIHDHGVAGGEDAPRLRREDKVQRFGRGDEDIGRMGDDRAALLRRRVAAARRHADVGRAQPPRLAFGGDAAQRRLQVFRHVHGERLQRRHIEHRHAAGAGTLGAPARARLRRDRRRAAHQTVDRRQERGQRLARAGRGDHQHILTRPDRGPRLALRFGRRSERMLEPRLGGLRKHIQTFVHMFDYAAIHRRATHRHAPRRSPAHHTTGYIVFQYDYSVKK